MAGASPAVKRLHAEPSVSCLQPHCCSHASNTCDLRCQMRTSMFLNLCLVPGVCLDCRQNSPHGCSCTWHKSSQMQAALHQAPTQTPARTAPVRQHPFMATGPAPATAGCQLHGVWQRLGLCLKFTYLRFLATSLHHLVMRSGTCIPRCMDMREPTPLVLWCPILWWCRAVMRMH